MTEEQKALREAVARALCDTEWGDGIWDKPGLLSQMEQDAYNGLATAAIDIVLEQAATTIAPPEMPPCRCVVWDNSGWFLECGCANNADIQEAAAWCARRNAAAEIRVLAAK